MANKNVTEIVIHHLSASKANQIQQFSVSGVKEITIGRDPRSNIAFDSDIVSRRHAVIRVRGDPISFRLADVGSNNGTFNNGERISGEVELLPGDSIELGKNGEKFVFDVQPRPANMVSRTRQMDIGDAGATRVIKTAEIAAQEAVSKSKIDDPAMQKFEPPPKTGVGKETVLRMLGEQRRSTSYVWIASLAGLATLAAAGGGALYWKQNQIENQRMEDLATQDYQRQEQQANQGLSPQVIVEKRGNGVAQIKRAWSIYYKNRPVFQKTVKLDGKEYPAYLQLPGDGVARWLTHDITNIPIGGTAVGSGFVVSDNGFMLTTKNIAAAWNKPFEKEDRANTYGHGWLFDANGGKPSKIDLSEEKYQSLKEWVPASGGIIILNEGAFFAGAAHSNPLKGGIKADAFSGRNDMLETTFPGSRVSVNASLSRISNESDAALIKVDTPQALTKLDLADNDTVTHGEQVTALGYPSVPTPTVATSTTVEAGQISENADVVPTPFVTEGIVSTTSPAIKKGNTIAGLTGDVIQMSINSTDAGNSGGPVFNKMGKVIGLLTYDTSKDGATTTVAVPIGYGRELLQLQQP